MTRGAVEPAAVGGFFPVIRRWGLVIAVATGIATLVGYGLARQATPTYEARADLLVGPLDADEATLRAATAAIATYAELATAPPTLEAVATATGIDRSQLRAGVRVTADPEARILRVRARAHDATAAAAAANGVADQLDRLIVEDSPAESGRVTRIDEATPPATPISPRVEVITPLAAMGGLLGGLALVMVLELVGDPAGSARDVARATRVPTLSLPAAGPGAGGDRGGTVLATHLGLARPDLRSVLLTGASGADGGGRLAAELATAWAATGDRVVVVDVHGGRSALTPGDGVEVIDGQPSDRPGRVVAELVATGARVVVHAPPVDAAPTTLAWAREVDATVLVSRTDTGRRGPLAETADALRRVGADVALAVAHPRGRAVTRRRPVVPVAAALLLGLSACASEPERRADAPAGEEEPPGERSASGWPALGGTLEGLPALDHAPEDDVAARLEEMADEARQVEPEARDPLLITDTEDVFVGDAQRAWTLALAHRVLRLDGAAEAAAAIVEDWVRTTETLEDVCPDSGGCSTSLMVSRAAPGFVFAAEVLAREGIWDEDQEQAFRTWLRDVILPAASDRDGNWGDAGTYLRVAAAIELGDERELARAADRWRERIDMIGPDGQIPEEVRREDAGLMYSQEALGYKVATADMLDRAGIDVWDVEGERGGSLRRALDLVVRSLDRPETWPVTTDDLRIPRPAALWSIAAARWDDPDYRALARVAGERDGAGHSAVLWTSVTHPG
ncbi:MAG TPA: alginate lyase family protein [Iamia sp.]|nr:alginate lyase family protein [Iamia sp.]